MPSGVLGRTHRCHISRGSEGSCCAILRSEATPGAHPRFVRIRHRQTKSAAAPRLAAQLTPRPLPTLAVRSLRTGIKGVRHARYGLTQLKGASSGADFGFWHLSPREKRRRLGRFRDRRRFMRAKSLERRLLAARLPPNSPPNQHLRSLGGVYLPVNPAV